MSSVEGTFTLRDVDRYLTLQRRGLDRTTGGGAEAEAEVARLRAAELEAEYPGLASCALRVQRAFAGTEQDQRFAGAEGAPLPFKKGARPASVPPRASAPWLQALGQRLERSLVKAAGASADALTAEFSERFEPLKRGEYDLVQRSCAENQVCVELRMRRSDLRDDEFWEEICDDLLKELKK